MKQQQTSTSGSLKPSLICLPPVFVFFSIFFFFLNGAQKERDKEEEEGVSVDMIM